MLKQIRKIVADPAIVIYKLEKKGLLDRISSEAYLKLIYRLTFHRKLNLDNPIAFTEKIAWYKLHWRSRQARLCADKLEVRKYVEEKIGPQYLIDLYGCWNSFEEVEFDKLPDQFILKPTNGSGDVLLCMDKSALDLNKAKRILCQYKNRHFSSKTKEWAYYDLPHRIIAERLLKRPDQKSIYDYKFFCFYGKPEFLLVGSDRESNVKFSYYDLNWNLIPVRCGHDYSPSIEKPEHFEEMLEVAHKLSEDFPQVRVDLYEEEGKVYFGEMTFYHYGGITKFEPDQWDYMFGKYFDISKIPTEQIE